MVSEPPLLTAVICVRDGERYLGAAIDSALAQTHPRVEVVVVDNGSTDSSGAIAHSYGGPVRVRDERRAGIPFARNAGLKEARGDFIAFLDADDVWMPEKTSLQLLALEGEDPRTFVLGHIQQQASPELDPDLTASLRIPEGPQPGLHVGTLLATREVWEEVGPWPTDFELSDGLHWFLRARGLGLRQLTIPEVVMKRRIHDANHSRFNRHRRGEFARILKDSIDARRRGGDPPSS